MSGLAADDLRRLYTTMTRIRLFEERVTREFKRGDIPGFVHTYIGAEAVASGICAHLTDSDFISSTHRGHGHCIAKGCSVRDMLAELYGRDNGLCKGRGGSMHIADFQRGMLGANAIVGGGIALAAGGALAARVRGTDGVAVTFFGDGAANQGVLHETMNLASIWKLPVIFVCENNGWAESTPGSYAHSVTDIAIRAAGYSIPGVVVDASDPVAVWEAGSDAVARARSGGGPTFIEAKVPRIFGHYLGDPEAYRSPEDRDGASSRDPLALFRERLLSSKVLSDEDVTALDAVVLAELDEGIAHAKSSPWPDAADVDKFVYAGAK
ncbi:MAG TPA: thiamine pyrophosphate-dependent dehydrogenase E1 component subunit alpha [Acidimicrobiia bacterium]|nr:thiamine pyrophosphate-dependent dehydrogenase E1 component subunit alpha [Acidimicrobiia bacterium]